MRAWRSTMLVSLLAGSAAHAGAQRQATAIDTVGIVTVITERARADSAHADSVRRDACHSSGIACEINFREPTWYLTPPTAFSAALARARALSTAAATEVLPPCPWRTTAPAPGFHVRAELRPLGSETDLDEVEVILRFRCQNPRGYLHGVYELDERLLVTRQDGRWQITSVRSRVT